MTFAQDWPNLARYQKQNAELPPSTKSRVVFMGDSITEGWSQDSSSIFQKNENYINRGISGQTTPQMLVRFRQDVVELNPSVVVILAGINDIAENTGPTTLEAILNNFKSMTEIAQANGIKVILCSTLPAAKFPWRPEINPTQKVVNLNKMLKKYADESGAYYLDYFSATVTEENGLQKEFTYDEVHLTRVGYQFIEPMVVEAIEKIINKK